MKPTTTTPLPIIPFPEAGSLMIKNSVASTSLKSDGTAATDGHASPSLERLLASSSVNTKLRRHQPKKGSTGKKGKIFAQKETMVDLINKVNTVEEETIAKKYDRQSRIVAAMTEHESKKVSKRQRQQDYIKKAKDSLSTSSDTKKDSRGSVVKRGGQKTRPGGQSSNQSKSSTSKSSKKYSHKTKKSK